MTSIAGKWLLHGSTLGSDGSTLYEWDADMTIIESGDIVKIAMETKGISGSNIENYKSSRSISYAEKLSKMDSGEWQLRFGYEADPNHHATADHDFFGLTQLRFSQDMNNAVGSSCNYNGRYVIIKLTAKRD